MKFGLLFITLWLSVPAFAEIRIQSISGYSDIRNFAPGGTNANIVILGGMGGDDVEGCASPNNATTCNNCKLESTTPAVCNERRVHQGLMLSFTFASTTVGAGGTAKLTLQGSGSGAAELPVASNPTLTVGSNQLMTVSASWNTIRSSMSSAGFANDTGTPVCSDKACMATFRLGFDENGDGLAGTADSVSITIVLSAPSTASFATVSTACATPGSPSTCTPRTCAQGLCNYSLFPGDEKAYIENTNFAALTTGREITGVVLICSPTLTLADVPVYSSGLRRATVVNGSLSEDFIEGLTNGEQYSCRSAIVDDTQNIMLYMSDAQGIICPFDDDNATASDTCHQVQPDAVLGLFKEKQNCFVATAAYGSPWMEQVKTLRHFRGKYLMTNSLGRKFVSWYYRNGPIAAEWIVQSEYRRTAARWMLTPVFASAYLLVHWPLTTVILPIVLIALVAFRRINKTRTQG